MINMDNLLVTGDEIRAFVAKRFFSDIPTPTNLKNFHTAIISKFGEREFDEDALEVLYEHYPRMQRHYETHGEPV